MSITSAARANRPLCFRAAVVPGASFIQSHSGRQLLGSLFTSANWCGVEVCLQDRNAQEQDSVDELGAIARGCFSNCVRRELRTRDNHGIFMSVSRSSECRVIRPPACTTTSKGRSTQVIMRLDEIGVHLASVVFHCGSRMSAERIWSLPWKTNLEFELGNWSAQPSVQSGSYHLNWVCSWRGV